MRMHHALVKSTMSNYWNNEKKKKNVINRVNSLKRDVASQQEAAYFTYVS